MKQAKSSTYRAIGPRQHLTIVCPLTEGENFPCPNNMTLCDPGFNEQIPQNSAGFLKLPPTSDPIPKTLDLVANRTAYPPVLPPDTFYLFQGFSTDPYILFVLS